MENHQKLVKPLSKTVKTLDLFFHICLHLAVLALHCLSLASGEPGDFNYICYGWRPTLSEIDKATHNNYK